MGETTIGWTATVAPFDGTTLKGVFIPKGTILPGYTYNPWSGCFKVSDGCKHCYAENLSDRWHKDDHLWGPHPVAHRRVASETYWQQPYKWNTFATRLGYPLKVFCASMADVFEDYPEPHILAARQRLWTVIEETPMLIWQLLTKRPENIVTMVPAAWLAWDKWPQRVWLGTSVENQEMAEKRMPFIVNTPADIIFLSVEPLLGPIDFKSIPFAFLINWMIVGGESGTNHRPIEVEWVRAIRDYCQKPSNRIAFFMKQWGGLNHTSGGRLLDGRTWDEFPS